MGVIYSVILICQEVRNNYCSEYLVCVLIGYCGLGVHVRSFIYHSYRFTIFVQSLAVSVLNIT